MNNVGDTFTIYLDKHTLPVSIVYVSAQIIKFKVELQDKYFVLQKTVLKKPYKWKIIEDSGDIDLQKLLLRLDYITKQIDSSMDKSPSMHEYLRIKKSY